MNIDYKCIKVLAYEMLFTGNPNEQLEISQIFYSNLKILENIKEESENLSTTLDPRDQSCFSASAVYTDIMYKLNWNKID